MEARNLAFRMAATVLAVSSLGCLPIPWEQQAVVRPDVDFRVTNADGAPVEGASVRLCRGRIGPPPSEVLNVWSRKTDADGRVSFSRKTTSETVYPLMMHGVPQRQWAFCIEHDDYRAVKVPERAAYTPGNLVTEGGANRSRSPEDELGPVRVELVADSDDGWTRCACRRDEAADGGSEGGH